MLKLMYITNDQMVARIAESAGVDRIFVDLEYIGKNMRQYGMDTVQNNHTIADVKRIGRCLSSAELLVRINPIHDATDNYFSSKQEIDDVIAAGAQIIMLPFFKTSQEVETFVKYVRKRARTMLLFETPEAIKNIDEILDVDGIDEVFIGLNDLSLGYGHKFMFKPLADGTVETVVKKFSSRHIPYGFGGIASLGRGMLPSEKVIAEHYRLNSTCVILSRSFCNTNVIDNTDVITTVFNDGIKQIRNYETYCISQSEEFFTENQRQVEVIVDKICENTVLKG